MIHSTMDAAEAVDIDRSSVAVVLQMLDARGDALSFAAARIIRSQEVTILSLDTIGRALTAILDRDGTDASGETIGGQR